MRANWRHFDPRRWATAHPRWTVAAFGLVSCVMVYGNLIAERGGVLDAPILDHSNAYWKSDHYVKEKRSDGFHVGDPLFFLIDFDGPIDSPKDLERIRDFTERVKREFGGSVMSLSEASSYEDTGEELVRRPYIPAKRSEYLALDRWKEDVTRNPAVFGTLIGRDFDWATVVRYTTPDLDPIAEYRRTVEFLEGRTIPWWEWLYKTDINFPQGVGVGGAFILQGLFDQALRIDNAVLVMSGMAIAFPLFVWFLGSLRQALIGVLGVVALGFLWTRGSIGLLQLLGLDVKERIFTLLAYTNCLVQGVSFALHKFEAFNTVSRSTSGGASLSERWNQATGNDRLIGATGLIAMFGFATLYSFQVRSIREIGIVSATGVACLLALTTLFVPAISIVTAGRKEQRIGKESPAAGVARRMLDYVVNACTALVTRRSAGWTARVAAAVTATLVLVATLAVWPGDLMVVKQDTSKLLEETSVGPTMRFLDHQGRLGRGAAEFLVESADGNDIYDPAFLERLAKYAERLRADPRIREVSSPVDWVRFVSSESLHKSLPATRQEARAVFNLIEADLAPAIVRQLYYGRGVRLTVHFVNEDTVVSRAVFEDALRTAQHDFPALRVSPFGRESQYPQLDEYVRRGKPINVFSSQLVVVCFCILGLWIHNRKTRSSGRYMQSLSPILGGFLMSVPFLFATALMVFVMIALDVPLDMATASIAALAINASVDFAIYFADSYQHGLLEYSEHAPAVNYAMIGKGRIVLEDMILNAICFLPLTLSKFEPIRDVGWIMIVMLLACAFGTVVLMPALFWYGLREPASVRPSRGGHD